MGKIIATMDEVAIGVAKAWEGAPANERAKTQTFTEPVPVDVAVGIVGWEPVAIELPSVVDPATMELYEVPNRYRQVVGRRRPDGRNVVINVAGEGYNKDLHNDMRQAVYVAADSELDVSLAVCHDDGQFMCLQMLAREGLNFGKPGGGFVPMVTLMASLTGATSVGLSTGTLRLFCTNQMRQFKADKARELRAKRTRNSSGKITPAAISAALEISFTETAEFVAGLDRLCNIGVSDAQFARIQDGWRPLHDAEGAPLTEGRGRTLRENDRGTLSRLVNSDPRVGLGQTVGGLVVAHNTYQHWEQNTRNSDNRIARMAQRASLSEADTLDAEFLAIVAGVVPEVSVALSGVPAGGVAVR